MEPCVPTWGEHQSGRTAFLLQGLQANNTRFSHPGMPALFLLGSGPGRNTGGEDGRGGQGQEVLSPSTVLDEATTKTAEAEGSGQCAHVPLPSPFFPVYLPPKMTWGRG